MPNTSFDVRRYLRTFSRLFVVLILAAVAGAMAWVQTVGFGPGITAQVSNGLSIGSVEVKIGTLTFNPFTGFVAENSTVTIPVPSGREINATVARIEIAPNLAALTRGQFLADSLLVESGEVTIPFAEDDLLPNSVKLVVEVAEILQTQTQVRIQRAKLALEGIRLDFKAVFQNPADLQFPKPTDEADPVARAQTIRAILKLLEEIAFHDGRPTITLEADGDLADLQTMRVPNIQVDCGAITYREVELDRISVDARYKAREIDIRKAELSGPDTLLQLTGLWHSQRGAGEFEVSGKVNPSPILASLGKPEISNEIRFLGTAEMESLVRVRSTVDGPDIRATGRIQSGAFEMRKVGAGGFSADFAWNNGKFYSTDARLELQSGTVTADVMSAPDDFRLRLKSTAIPTELLPIMGKYERAVVEVMEFKDAPELEITVTGKRPHMNDLTGRGHVRLGRTSMRGAWIDSATADIVVGDRAAKYENIRLKMDGGEATGAFTYDFGRREVRLGNVKSRVMPAEILMWVDPRIAATVAVYKFLKPPYVEADGLVHMENPDLNALEVSVESKGGLDYELIGKMLRFGDTRATVNLKGQKVFADVSRSELYGGTVRVKAEISTNPKDPTFGADLELSRIDFASITNKYFGYEKSKGVMSGKYQFTAQLRDDSSMKGTGSIRVEDGHVLAIPVFGPLSEIISTIIPGAGHESARLATADFEIANRKISSSNLEIEGDGFSLFGSGDVRYPSGQMDMTVRINARGIPGIVLFPVSKLLEYVSTGTVSDPQWRPKIVPREFFEILGMAPKDDDADAPPPAKPSASPAKNRSRVLITR